MSLHAAIDQLSCSRIIFVPCNVEIVSFSTDTEISTKALSFHYDPKGKRNM